MKVSSTTLPHDTWGQNARAWRLIDRDDLGVAEELMPAGESEMRHYHSHTRQFFYVLSGTLSMETDSGVTELHPGDGLEIAPGTPHRAFNAGPAEVRFLVAASGRTKTDRTNLG